MKEPQLIIDKSQLDKAQYKALMEVCQEYNIVYIEASEIKKAGAKRKISKEKFKLVYSKWLADNITMNEALDELDIKKPTFYSYMKSFGLSIKSEVKVEEKAKAILLGIDENRLVISHEMKIKDILEVVKKAVTITTVTPRATELGIEYLDEAVCFFILEKMNYEGSKQGFADAMHISKTTYSKYMKIIENSSELYDFAIRVYKKITVLPK